MTDNISEIPLKEETKKKMAARRESILAALKASENKSDEPVVALSSVDWVDSLSFQNFGGNIGLGNSPEAVVELSQKDEAKVGPADSVEKEKVKKNENPFTNIANEIIKEINTRPFTAGGPLIDIDVTLGIGNDKVKEIMSSLSAEQREQVEEYRQKSNDAILAAMREWNKEYKKYEEGEKENENEKESVTIDAEEVSVDEQARRDREEFEKNKEKAEIVGADNKEEEKKNLLLEKVEENRNDFADLEFRNRQSWGPIKKFFSLGSDKESPEVGEARSAYKTSLKEYINSEVKKLEESGKNGLELKDAIAELYTTVNYKEFLSLYDARTEAKMAYLTEKEGKSKGKYIWDSFKLGSAVIAEKYNKLPWQVKLGIAGTVFTTGATALIAARRIWGAFMMASVGGAHIDKIAHMFDQMKNYKEKNEFAFGAVEENNSVDFEKLQDKLNNKINEIDEKYRRHTRRSNINKCIAMVSGMILGCSATAAAADCLSEKMTIPKEKLVGRIPGFGESKLDTPVKDSFIKPQSIPAPFTEHVPTSGPTVANASLNELTHQGEIAKQVVDGPTIEAAKVAGAHLEVVAGSGRSIEGELIGKLKELGVKDPGAEAHRMVLKYAEENKIAFGKLNHIKSANFDISVDDKGLHKIDKLDFKGIVHHAHAGGVEHAQPGVPSANLEAVNDSAFENEVNAANPYAGEMEGAKSDLAAASRAVEEAVSRHVAPPSGTFLHDENFGPKQVTDLNGPDADRVAALAADREMHARFLEKIGAKSNTFHDITKSSAKELAKGDFGKWQTIKEASYKDTINQYGMKTRMTKLLGKFESLLGKDAIKPQGGGSEKMGHYIARLSKMAAEKGK